MHSFLFSLFLLAIGHGSSVVGPSGSCTNQDLVWAGTADTVNEGRGECRIPTLTCPFTACRAKIKARFSGTGVFSGRVIVGKDHTENDSTSCGPSTGCTINVPASGVVGYQGGSIGGLCRFDAGIAAPANILECDVELIPW